MRGPTRNSVLLALISLVVLSYAWVIWRRRAAAARALRRSIASAAAYADVVYTQAAQQNDAKNIAMNVASLGDILGRAAQVYADHPREYDTLYSSLSAGRGLLQASAVDYADAGAALVQVGDDTADGDARHRLGEMLITFSDLLSDIVVKLDRMGESGR